MSKAADAVSCFQSAGAKQLSGFFAHFTEQRNLSIQFFWDSCVCRVNGPYCFDTVLFCQVNDNSSYRWINMAVLMTIQVTGE